jgi:hypothetical protein
MKGAVESLIMKINEHLGRLASGECVLKAFEALTVKILE